MVMSCPSLHSCLRIAIPTFPQPTIMILRPSSLSLLLNAIFYYLHKLNISLPAIYCYDIFFRQISDIRLFRPLRLYISLNRCIITLLPGNSHIIFIIYHFTVHRLCPIIKNATSSVVFLNLVQNIGSHYVIYIKSP